MFQFQFKQWCGSGSHQWIEKKGEFGFGTTRED